MGNYCDEYVSRLRTAIANDRESVADYIDKAPLTPASESWRDQRKHNSRPMTSQHVSATNKMQPTTDSTRMSRRSKSFESTTCRNCQPHDETIVAEVGVYFTWAWPFFRASVSGTWPKASTASEGTKEVDVDEDVPGSLSELSLATALPERFLEQLAEAFVQNSRRSWSVLPARQRHTSQSSLHAILFANAPAVPKGCLMCCTCTPTGLMRIFLRG